MNAMKRLPFFLLGVVFGVLVIWGLSALRGPSGSAQLQVVEGYSNGTNNDGTAIGIAKEPGGPGEGYIIAGAEWREFGGPWHDAGTPPSLAQPRTGQKVRLGVVDVEWQGSSRPVVAWLEVLSE